MAEVTFKIYLKQKKQYFNLFLGVLWLIYGIYRLISNDGIKGISYAFIIVSLAYIISFVFFFFKPVLIIEKDQIIYNDLFKRKIFKRNDITGINRFAGDYTFITDTDKFTINKDDIDKDSAEKLNKFIEELPFRKK